MYAQLPVNIQPLATGPTYGFAGLLIGYRFKESCRFTGQ
jgi:hypothetical protein